MKMRRTFSLAKQFMYSNKLERWSQTRELGKQRFILRFGVLQWGITTGACFWLLRTWKEVGSGGYVEQLSSNLGGLVSGVLIFSAVGALFGLITWNNLEKQVSCHPRRGRRALGQ